MDPVAVAFLAVGGLGLLVLVVSLLAGELGDLGHADADGPFSVPAIAAFLGGIGFGGAAASALLPELPGPATVLLALVAGLVVALPLAAGAVRLSAALRDMPTEPTLTAARLLGAQGVVISRVPPGGFGEVRLAVAGQQLKYHARSDVPLPAGTPVYVVDVPTETSVHVVSTAPETTVPLPDTGGTP
ncbi:NfeD family protein [Modestobacter sp. SSW1-42]|uniref:NfeD family protein n=1 Tax=Modestobacter sp. SSW1-42 TaxID=596372 RepID=UPI0039888482